MLNELHDVEQHFLWLSISLSLIILDLYISSNQSLLQSHDVQGGSMYAIVYDYYRVYY